MATTTIYGSQPLAKDTTFVQGVNSIAYGIGSFAQGNSTNYSITASKGGFAQGNAVGSNITAAYGAFAQGYTSGGTISGSNGSFAQGMAYGGDITAGIGGMAQGYAFSGYGITAGYGGFAQGWASGAGITATNGAFAHGNAYGYAITASGYGSFATGYANSAAIVASAENAAQFGKGTNATADSLQVGGGVLLEGTGDITASGLVRSAQPHLMQSDSTTQSVANVSNAQVVTFDTDVHADGITRTSSSRFTIIEPGTYLIAISAILNTTVAAKHGEIWLRVNGADVPASNSRLQMSANVETILAVTFNQAFSAGQYFEFWFWGDNTGVQLLATAAGSTPTRPAVPSIIMTTNYVGSN